jgi:hypothetical protein
MKKLLLVFIFILISTVILTAGEYDSLRAHGMGGAYTALADDSNALFLNPAGLAFARKGEVRVSAAGGVSLTKQMVMGDSAYPEVYESWNYEDSSYVTYDSFYGRDVYFDPAEYGFPWSDDTTTGLPTYQEAIDSYMEFQEAFQIYEDFINISDIGALPRFLVSGGWWSVANISRVDIELQPGYFDNNDPQSVPLNVNISRDGGLIGGAGIKLGIFSVGANAKFFKRSTETYAYEISDFEYGPPEDLLTNIALGNADTEIISEGRFELGTGALVALGPWNAGVYLDNLMAFLDEDKVDFGAIFDTLNMGVAWTPTNKKTAEKRSALNLVLAADLRNIGSSEARTMSLGAETGLDLGGLIVVNGRAGYSQPLPGALLDIGSAIDPLLGTYTAGFQAKFFFLDFQVAADFPADLIFDPPSYPLAEGRGSEPFARIRGEISLVF